MIHKWLAASIAACGLALGSAGPAMSVDAEISVAADGKRKINLAGRQRMLVQRMAKAACLMSVGIEAEEHLGELTGARDLFATTLRDLRYGNRDAGLLVEANESVALAQGKVSVAWKPYGAAIGQIVEAGRADAAAMDVVAKLNLSMLRTAHDAVTATEAAYGAADVPLHLAIAINVAGRQRMLTQKMSKEVCLIAAGVAVEEHRASLADTASLFDASLEALSQGLPMLGIRAPQQPRLIETLGEVRAQWAALKPVVDAVAEGADPRRNDVLARVAALNGPLLKTMNDAVFLFESEG